MTKIALASCCKYRMQKEQPAWAAIEAERPDLLLLLGDNVYMIQREWDHADLEEQYQLQFSEPHFKSLISKVPFMATWDDHDFGTNDSRGALVEDWKRKKSRDLFHKYMKGAIHHNRPEVYTSHVVDDIKIIMLDVRYYREAAHPKRPSATLLGKKQEEWLFSELQHDKQYTLIGSGTPLTGGGTNETWESYTNFYNAFRQQMAKVKRVLFLSGDIHRNKFVDHGDFFEVTTSGVARYEAKGQWPNQTYGKPLDNYGMLNITKSAVRVSLQGRRKVDQFEGSIKSSSWTLE
jgi:alkaline phosphatase D